MADTITITHEHTQRTLPTPGTVLGVCVDVIDLGEAVEQYQQQPARVVKKAAVVYWLDEINPDTEKPFELSREFTVSFGEKAALRKWLTSWRGKEYTQDEAAKGVPLHKLEGHSGLLTVEHKTSGAGKLYAKLGNIVPLIKGVQPMKASGYQRSEFWAKKKQEYAEAVAKHRASQSAPGADWEDVVAAVEDDDLPF